MGSKSLYAKNTKTYLIWQGNLDFLSVSKFLDENMV